VATTNGVARLVAVDGRPADSPELAGRFDLHPVAGLLENGEPDVLYLNDGAGRFTAVPWDGGAFLDEDGRPMAAPHDWGLAAMFRDVNGDGAPDLYVCNDFQSPDRLWLKDGRGRFRAAPRAALGQTSLFSMGVDFTDVDRDGHDDFFVADMLSRDQRLRQVQLMDAAAVAAADPGGSDRPQSSRNTLFWNRGDGTWAEVARLAGVEASEWSWCPAFLDVDLDGFEDLLITTGHERDAQNADVAGALAAEARAGRLSFTEQLGLRRRFPRLDTPNVAFRNRGDLTFEDAGAAWGFDSRRVSQGLALADLDGDGDLDVVVNCLNDGPLVLRNNAARPSLLVRLRGRPPNTSAVGARVRVLAPGLPPQTQEIIAGGRYVSDDDDARAFAAGDSGRPLTVEVTWRSGARSVVTNVPPGQLCELDEAAASPAPAATPAPASAPPLFTEVGPLPGTRAEAAPFDDLARQPLLPRRVSAGPAGLAWFDFNGDGWDDLLAGAPRGGRMAVFRNDGRGGFVPQRAALLEAPAAGALRSLLGWRAAPDQPVLLLSVSDWEDDTGAPPALVEIALASGAAERLPLAPGAGGPLALADFDGDGRLDLFVGGGPIPGRYPEAGPSQLFLGHEGRFIADADAGTLLATAGLVNGAVFTDLDGDGRPELVLATGWGPLRILRRSGEGVQWWRPAVVWDPGPGGAPTRLGLDEMTGRWTSVAAGDFDGDGRMDLMAGNWGRNHRDARYLSQALE
ncbi:MAG TPA: VCBS repeat-containing protein, partial [Verrucomicrobiota bacterium]|nr:VCBS repeat-containing protein [Verrucomicrobiota bacterium]